MIILEAAVWVLLDGITSHRAVFLLLSLKCDLHHDHTVESAPSPKQFHQKLNPLHKGRLYSRPSVFKCISFSQMYLINWQLGQSFCIVCLTPLEGSTYTFLYKRYYRFTQFIVTGILSLVLLSGCFLKMVIKCMSLLQLRVKHVAVFIIHIFCQICPSLQEC